jgi:transglutaminase-like putative cysteine protease
MRLRPLGALGAAVAAQLLLAGSAGADTLFLQGRMGGRVTLEITERYDPAPGTSWISLRSHRTPSFGSTTWRQTVVSEEVTYSVDPAQAAVSPDESGNRVLTERWEQPRTPITIVRKIQVDTEATLGPLQSQAPFPPGQLAPEVARFLRATAMTQAQDPKIQGLARRLVSGAKTERQAVTAILNHVVDTLAYQYDPPAHDALGALERRFGNCQGFSHLSIALLRAAGIPARLTVGISLAKGWRVTHPDGTLTFKMGQGRHAWIEVYYPDLGWIPYDPQSSHLFVSIYHVRQAVGLDVTDVVGMITAMPTLPGMQDTINGDGLNESIAVRTVSTARTPHNYVVSPDVRDAVVVVTPPPPVTPPPVTPPPAVTPPPGPPPIRRQDLTRLVEFGNLEFPASLRIFGSVEVTGGVVQSRRTFIVETADYATGREELAQAFSTDRPLILGRLSLALQKFGGSTGELWIELFEAAGRKPGARLAESRRLPVAGLIERGGYRWVVFDFGPGDQAPLLGPGRYWAVLRSTGDGIFNWYFSLGNAYGDPDDTRSRPRGASDWSNILNYRFNFRVTGLVKP